VTCCQLQLSMVLNVWMCLLRLLRCLSGRHLHSLLQLMSIHSRFFIECTVCFMLLVFFYLIFTIAASSVAISECVNVCGEKCSCTFNLGSVGPAASFYVTSCKLSLSIWQFMSACLVSVTTSIIGVMYWPVPSLALSSPASRFVI